MLNTSHFLSGLDATTTTFAIAVFLGGATLAVFAVLIIYLIRRAGLAGIVGVLSGAGLVLVGAMLAAVLLDRHLLSDRAEARRTIELRSAELTARAIAPGSALACLDGMTSAVESACEKAIFATPEAVASAVDYVDARLSLLAASAAVAGGDKAPSLERFRRSLEADRFGLVAHVLVLRGCSAAQCTEFALLHDTERVVANMKAQTFESQVGMHALAWQPGGSGPTLASTGPGSPASPASGVPSTALTGISPMMPTPATTGGPPGKFDFPSSASIPAVSIMNAEPGTPPSAEAKPAAAPVPKRPPAPRHAAKPPARTAAAPLQTPPPPPLNTLPPPPQRTEPPEPPQTSGSGDRQSPQ